MKKIIIVVMVMVVMAVSPVFAGDNSWTQTTNWNTNTSTDIGRNLRDIAFAKMATGFLATFMETAFQPQYQQSTYYQPVRNYSSKCSRYAGNFGALSACERGVSQRNLEIQQRLEQDAYNSGLNGSRSSFY